MIRTCAACGTQNRIPATHLADRGHCGKCKAELAPMAKPLAVNAAEFDDIVRGARVPVLIDFWAGWCGPCRMVAPEVAKVAAEMAGRALVLKVDTDANPELASRFQITGIPHFVIMQGGKVALAKSGAVSAAQIRAWLDQARVAQPT